MTWEVGEHIYENLKIKVQKVEATQLAPLLLQRGKKKLHKGKTKNHLNSHLFLEVWK